MADSGFLAGTIIAVLQATGYAGLIGLMALESACIPLPSEIILPFAGYLASKGDMNVFLIATLGALGCNLGSLVAYWVGRWGGRTAILRWGKYVLLTRHDLDVADSFFSRFGGPAVLIGRMLPVVRTFIALPAGISHMPQGRFHIYTYVGSWPWCLMLGYVGYILGKDWSDSGTLSSVFHYLDYAIIALVVVFIARFVWARWNRRPEEQPRS
ncbi:DedA family protein [Jiella sp. M17.18]|uniref:DedA family protein n=1 Tax=Jiella sp. M17.18 TaxID=3234247 RepID=UPI0034DE8D6C